MSDCDVAVVLCSPELVSPRPAPPPRWIDDPRLVALVPIRERPVARYVDHLDASIAGPTAPVVFRNDVAEMDVRLWVEARGWRTPALTRADQQRLVDQVGLASWLALGRYTTEVVHRSDAIGIAWDSVRTLLGPTLVWNADRDGRWKARVGPADPLVLRDRLALASTVERRGRPPPRRVRTGAGLQFRDPLDAREEDPLFAATVYVAGDRVLVDQWRGAVDPTTRTWTGSLREGVLPRTDLVVVARSRPVDGDGLAGVLEPDRLSVGAIWQPPGARLRSWQVQVTGTALPRRFDRAERETELRLDLRARWPWKAPQEPGEPLGAREGYPAGDAPGTDPRPRWDH